jgi:hypothetical protein
MHSALPLLFFRGICSRRNPCEGGVLMYGLEAPWIGHPDEDDEEKEEYIPEYYPECDCDDY